MSSARKPQTGLACRLKVFAENCQSVFLFLVVFALNFLFFVRFVSFSELCFNSCFYLQRLPGLSDFIVALAKLVRTRALSAGFLIQISPYGAAYPRLRTGLWFLHILILFPYKYRYYNSVIALRLSKLSLKHLFFVHASF